MKTNNYLILLLILLLKSGFSNAEDYRELLKKAVPSGRIVAETEAAISGAEWFQPVSEEVKRLLADAPEQFSLRIPSVKGEIVLELKRAELESPGFRIRTSGNKLFDQAITKPLHYQGEVRGRKKSLAALSISEHHFSALFSAGEGNLNLVQYQGSVSPLYALFNDHNILEKNTFQCHSEGLSRTAEKLNKQLERKSNPGVQSGNCRRTDIYFECDHQLFLDKGGSVDGAVAYVESLFNVVAALYAMDGVNVRISEIFVHTQPDSYPSETSFAALDAFMDSVITRPAFNGNLGHLLSTLPRANGGVAYLDVLCSAGSGSNIAYSNIYNSFLPLPYYSWNVNVVAHELGHNFGSPHTQSCSWEISPGNFGMLDSCYIAEGECYTGPRIASAGTIMSYCHLMNLGIDMSKGFGLLPGTLIRNNYLNAACLSGAVDFPPLSISSADSICRGSTVNLTVTAVSGASYQWTGPNGFSAATSSIIIPNAGPAQEGEYTVIVSKDGCDALPLSSRISVNCIYAIPLANQVPCRQSSFAVNYESTFAPAPGNQFFAEISDVSGSFSNPLLIGSVASNSRRGSIQVQLPPGIVPDSGYLLRIRSSNPAKTGEPGKQVLRILPLPAKPLAQDKSRCGPGSLLLEASAIPGDSIFWYASGNAETPLASGNFFNTPILNTGTSYWAGSQSIKKAGLGPVPDFSSGDTLTVANTYHGIYVRVKKPLSLDSVLVFASGPGTVHINIKDSANTFLYKKITRELAGSISGEKISVGIVISPGIYRIDAENSTVPRLLRLNNFYAYPQESEGMDITGSSVPGRYYFFYDWKFRILGCPGELKEVRAEVFPVPAAPQAINAKRCGPGSLVLRASGAGPDQFYRWYNVAGGPPLANQNSDSLLIANQTAPATTYYVSLAGPGSCESSLQPLSATINPQPAAPVISQSGQYLISSADTLLQWYLNGQFLGTFGDTLDAAEFGNGQYNAVLLTTDSCSAGSNQLSVSFTGLVGDAGFSRGVLLYPNPLKDWFSLSLESGEMVRVQLLDITGRKMLESAVRAGEKIFVQHLPPGSYFMDACFSDGRIKRERMVKF